MPDNIRVAAFCGSLRKGSYNAAALRAAIELKPDGMEIDVLAIDQVPLYNEDMRLQGYPPPVAKMRADLAAADAVLFVTPEYNYSVPGVLKNAIDWASRPPDQPFNGKPVAIMGASPGMVGTARAQYHLRQMMVFLNAFPLNKPEVMISLATSKFDEQGELTDQKTREIIQQQLVALQAWTLKLR